MEMGIMTYNIRKKQVKKNNIQIKKRLPVSIGILHLFLVIAVRLSSAVFGSDAVDAKASYKYYTSIQVQEGDSLWSIADKYLTAEYNSHETYMKELISINHLSDTTIHAGQYLTVPYFSYEYK